MPTECSAKPMGFARVDGRAVVADFDGGAITSNAGGLLLGATDRAIGLVERFAACFADGRDRRSGWSTRWRRWSGSGCSASRSATRTWSTTTGCATTRCSGWCSAGSRRRHGRCAPLAGKSTLNRLEHGAAGADRYRRIAHDGAAIEALFVDLFLDAHEQAAEGDRARSRRHRRPAARPPGGAVLPRLLRLLLLPAALRLLRPPPAGGEAPARRHRRLAPARSRRWRASSAGSAPRWPRVRILLRGDSGFAREDLDGLVRGRTGSTTCSGSRATPGWSSASTSSSPGPSTTPKRAGRPARRFADFRWTTRESWSRRRRVVAKAEWMPGRGARGANPRFVVTSLKPARADARTLYEQIYCARGEMENRIKECQLDLFADRTSAATMRANQLRLWFASMAYVLVTRAAPHRPRRHRARRRHLRQHPPEAPEDRRPGHPQRPPHPRRHGLELSRRRRLPPRARPIMRLIRNRPAQPPAPPTNPDFDRAEAQRAAVPNRPAASARQHDPIRRDLHEGPGEKCGLKQKQIGETSCEPFAVSLAAEGRHELDHPLGT